MYLFSFREAKKEQLVSILMNWTLFVALKPEAECRIAVGKRRMYAIATVYCNEMGRKVHSPSFNDLIVWG
jgi:hypothetical protein